ncbi:MAG: hypothetical protein ABI613_06345 [Gemmatimonadota bacterium]
MKVMLLYLVLVGLPILGVSMIVKAGGRIVPPISVGGIWRLAAVQDSSCRGMPFPDTLVMTVAQSGPELIVHLNARARPLIGSVDGPVIQVSDGDLRVRGSLGPDTSMHEIKGTISGLPCKDGTTAGFTGRRTHSAAAARAH